MSGLNIAEMFISLGVRGSDKTSSVLSQTKKSLEDVKSSGLAAKASIIGLVVGLERMMSSSGKLGSDLSSFANSTGLSVVSLQKWQVAAENFGVKNEEVAASIKSVQESMTNMILGKGSPEGFGLFAQAVGFDPARARDTFYVMNKLMEFARIYPHADIANSVLKSFGISDNMFQFLRTNKTEIDKLRPSNIFTEREIQTLARVDAQWERFWRRIKIVMGSITTVIGPPIVGALENSLKALEFLFKKFSEFIKKISPDFKFLKETLAAIGIGVLAWVSPLTGAISAIIFLLDQFQKMREGKSNIFSGFLDWQKEMHDLNKEKMKDQKYPNQIIPLLRWTDEFLKFVEPKKPFIGPPSEDKPGASLNIQKIEINAPGGNPERVRAATVDGIQQAYRQMSAQALVT